MKTLRIQYKDYDPTNTVEGEIFAYQKSNTGGWLTREDVEGHLQAAFEHVLNTMQPGDQLSITIEVQPKSEAKA